MEKDTVEEGSMKTGNTSEQFEIKSSGKTH